MPSADHVCELYKPGDRVATKYLHELYRPGDRVATVLIPRDVERGQDGVEPKVEQRVWPVSAAGSDKVQAWQRHLNAGKYDVFVGMNPMRERARTRHKEDVLAVDRVWLDIDEDGPKRLERILGDAREGRIGMPRWALETSPGRVQVVWQLEKRGSLEPGRAEALMRGLVQEYGGDRAAVDVSRVLRWPGFRNWKRDGHLVDVVWRCRASVEPEQFPERLYREADLALRSDGVRRRGPAPREGGHDMSRSGRDWRWVRKALRRGDDPDEVALELERERQDKSNPRDYARRTVQNARRSMGLDSGMSR